jgi:hypothetical protein
MPLAAIRPWVRAATSSIAAVSHEPTRPSRGLPAERRKRCDRTAGFSGDLADLGDDAGIDPADNYRGTAPAGRVAAIEVARSERPEPFDCAAPHQAVGGNGPTGAAFLPRVASNRSVTSGRASARRADRKSDLFNDRRQWACSDGESAICAGQTPGPAAGLHLSRPSVMRWPCFVGRGFVGRGFGGVYTVTALKATHPRPLAQLPGKADPSPAPVRGWRCTTRQAITAAAATIASAMKGNAL